MTRAADGSASVPAGRTRMTGPQRRAQLLEVGRSVFAQHGREGASVEEVASRAGVSKPVVYEHFGGKDALYDAVVDVEVRALLAALTTAGTADQPQLLLEQAVRALLGYVEGSADGVRILVRESAAPRPAPRLGDVARLVEDLLADGLAVGGPVPLYAQALVGQVALVGLCLSRERSHDGHRAPDVAAHLADLVWNGLSGAVPVDLPVDLPVDAVSRRGAARP